MSAERKKLLEVENLTVRFGSRRHPFTAVNGVSFHIFEGETFGLVGESGSGKTTIGRAIIRIHPTSAGTVTFDGKQINGRIPRALDHEVTRRIQMIFQDPMASLNERAKVDYIVAEGLYSNGFHLTKAEREARVEKALQAVGLLPEFASRFPHEFSGGQRQRIGIARALVMEPDFIIADEPISALDVSIRAQVLNLLSELQKARGLTYLFIAHDLSVVRFICDRIAVIHKGDIVELAESEELFARPLHPTRARCSPPSPSRTRWPSATRSCWCTTPPATITAPATSLPGRRPIPATMCSPAARKFPSIKPCIERCLPCSFPLPSSPARGWRWSAPPRRCRKSGCGARTPSSALWG